MLACTPPTPPNPPNPHFHTHTHNHQVGQAAFFFALGGVPYLVWGFVIRVLLTMHMTWLVNSAVHIWGDRR